MTDKTQPTAHAEITAPISADLRGIDDAGAQPAPAQLPKTLRELAEVVHDWGKRDQAWAHPDPDCFDVALFGHISEDGEPYPVAEVNADTYGHEGVSLQLAQFYAAASPAAMLALLDRVELRDNELKAARADIKHWRSNHDNVVARLRIFTQRPDISKELADRLPWYRELVRLQAVAGQAAAKCLHQGADAAAVAALKGLLSLVRREAPQLSGKVLGDAESAIAALQAAPPAPAAVAVPTDSEIIELLGDPKYSTITAVREALQRWGTAGPARDSIQSVAVRDSLRALIEAIEYTPLGLRAIRVMTKARAALAAAPAQAVAVPWDNFPAYLIDHCEGDTITEEGLQQALAAMLADPQYAAPAQEHATQLAGKGLRQGVWLKPARAGRVYVAGPMTGLPEFNFPAFHAKAAELRASGWHVENPAEHGHVEGAEWADYLHYDIGRMATCSTIHLLPGWCQSRGAALEVHVASVLGMEFQYAEGAEMYHAPAQAQEDALDAAELEEVQRAISDFEDCGETHVSHDLLLRAANLGYLDCTRFSTTDDGQAKLDAARAAQGGAA